MLCSKTESEKKQNIKSDKNFEKPKVTMKVCDRILNYEPDMMLRQNSVVFIVFDTVTPIVKNVGVVP